MISLSVAEFPLSGDISYFEIEDFKLKLSLEKSTATNIKSSMNIETSLLLYIIANILDTKLATVLSYSTK